LAGKLIFGDLREAREDRYGPNWGKSENNVEHNIEA